MSKAQDQQKNIMYVFSNYAYSRLFTLLYVTAKLGPHILSKLLVLLITTPHMQGEPQNFLEQDMHGTYHNIMLYICYCSWVKCVLYI